MTFKMPTPASPIPTPIIRRVVASVTKLCAVALKRVKTDSVNIPMIIVFFVPIRFIENPPTKWKKLKARDGADMSKAASAADNPRSRMISGKSGG